MVILILFATLSGLVTVLSPCILPALPIVLSSSAASGRARPLGVITGLMISFSLFTLAISKIVSLLGLSANALRLGAVVIIAILGLSLLIPAFNQWVELLLSALPGSVNGNSTQGAGFWQGFLTGASLGLIWAPCAGPILAAVTTLAATQTITFGAALVVIFYAIGSGIPLLLIAYGGRAFINKVSFLSRNLEKVQQTFGAVMVLTALLIAFNMDTLVTSWVTEMVPSSWTTSLNSFESNPVVSSQLIQLKQDASTDQKTEAPTATIPMQSIPPSGNNALPNYGPAPEFVEINHWINSQPLTMKDLKGKVVLVDFWTYTCINCIHTLPYVTDWYNKYHDQGFVVIGVHTPEFTFEHETSNVENAVKQYKIYYPVAQDNNYVTWGAYQNEYWPAEYLIDADGNLRYTHFGEGSYDETEKNIQQLLAEAEKSVSKPITQ
jgi:cytochrome c biogenesis protein CcdA/thiol-disulfide isomerase/thioredoxin